MLTVQLELVVNSPPDKVWELVGPFGSVAQWHPEVDSSETSEDEAGNMLRTLVFKNGQKVVERATRYDDASHSYWYTIVKSKLPVLMFVGMFQVFGSGAQSRIVWNATFEAAPGVPEERAVAIVDGILQSAAPGLTAKLG